MMRENHDDDLCHFFRDCTYNLWCSPVKSGVNALPLLISALSLLSGTVAAGCLANQPRPARRQSTPRGKSAAQATNRCLCQQRLRSIVGGFADPGSWEPVLAKRQQFHQPHYHGGGAAIRQQAERAWRRARERSATLGGHLRGVAAGLAVSGRAEL